MREGYACERGTLRGTYVGGRTGEYLFDHRNSSLRQWLLDTYIGSNETGMGHKDIDGMFLDDVWDGVKGPSEFVCGGRKPCSPRKSVASLYV